MLELTLGFRAKKTIVGMHGKLKTFIMGCKKMTTGENHGTKNHTIAQIFDPSLKRDIFSLSTPFHSPNKLPSIINQIIFNFIFSRNFLILIFNFLNCPFRSKLAETKPYSLVHTHLTAKLPLSRFSIARLNFCHFT